MKTKGELLTSEIIHNYICDYDLETIENTIADKLGVERNTEYEDKYFKLDLIQVTNIITMKLLVRSNVNNSWIKSPTVQFSYKLDENNNFVNVITHEGFDEISAFINKFICDFKDPYVVQSNISKEEADKMINNLRIGDYYHLYESFTNENDKCIECYTLRVIPRETYVNDNDIKDYKRIVV